MDLGLIVNGDLESTPDEGETRTAFNTTAASRAETTVEGAGTSSLRDSLRAGMLARKNSKCPHGLQKHACKECGGSEICPHGRQKDTCKECNNLPSSPQGRSPQGRSPQGRVKGRRNGAEMDTPKSFESLNSEAAQRRRARASPCPRPSSRAPPSPCSHTYTHGDTHVQRTSHVHREACVHTPDT